MIKQATRWLPVWVVGMDAVFKALADPSRRQLLDRLHSRDGQSLVELSAGLGMTRQAVSKHLALLEAANLVVPVRRGRDKLHYLNPAPINELAERWLGRYNRERLQALANLKLALEGTPMTPPVFVYVTYIETTPEKLWQALTDAAFTLQYWGMGLKSDWRVGSPVLAQWGPDQPFVDIGQVVLEADPPRRLSYRWHTYQPEHRHYFDWSDERFAELIKEPQSKVTFELESQGSFVKLTLIHDDFVPDSEMYRGTKDGWPAILSNLKTLLETGKPLSGE